MRGVQPAGQIWVIRELKADVKDDGRIGADGRGLLLGGGNNIGGNASASVFATLICEAMAPFTERSTTLTGVPLEPNGDFRIDDVLTPAAGWLRQSRASHPQRGQLGLVRRRHSEGLTL